ncbi:uncharacterized protein B0J16DRAFT_368450 [Fusarium flagelliforme]|uniref:uncharacterized protein n=1 Tax=Fusarium flagelliforme TaxID=2675880 RepID=UPI001E8D1D67|nr:uncharacterized protein B0J16DRAFT_368450 [Fusarium flagelliforme]KAH7192183.1 hypothetical protein B0J16DRAFT_368450 [Fusarium flagelliforme]
MTNNNSSMEDTVTVSEAVKNTTKVFGRQAGSMISSADEMVEDELLTIGFLAKFENKYHHRGRDTPLTMTDWRRFLTKIFEVWHTGCVEEEEVPLGKLPETRVKVGKLKYDHPPTKEFPKAQQPPSRRRDAPVYLSVTTKAIGEMVEFMWKDGRGKFVGSSHVELTVESYGRAMYQTVKQYDMIIRQAYARHNEALTIRQARRHIVFFAERGTAHGVRSGPWPLPPDYLEPEFAGPRVQRLAGHYTECMRLWDEVDQHVGHSS